MQQGYCPAPKLIHSSMDTTHNPSLPLLTTSHDKARGSYRGSICIGDCAHDYPLSSIEGLQQSGGVCRIEGRIIEAPGKSSREVSGTVDRSDVHPQCHLHAC